jgi:hypothetical protein
MSDPGAPKVLRDLVMGHRTSEMEGVYAHVTPGSRPLELSTRLFRRSQSRCQNQALESRTFDPNRIRQ